MNIGSLFNLFLVHPIVNILLLIYRVLLFLHVPYPLGFSIILLTIVIRLLLYPFTASQLKTSKKMQELNPHLSRLKEKHKSDAKMLQSETMRLYKEHGVNPAAGCLPMLIQLPLIWALYSVLQSIVGVGAKDVVKHVNNMAYVSALQLTRPWEQTFFAIPLAQTPSHLFASMPLIVLIPILTGVLQFVQSQMMFAPQAPIEKPKKKDSTSTEESFASAFQTQSMYIFPVMIGFLSFTFPIGLSLYWNTFTIFGILQQYKLQGWGGLVSLKQKLLPQKTS